MRAGTLSLRLFLLTSIWALVSVTLVAIVLTGAYRQNAEKRFGQLLTANLYNLMASVEAGEDGRLTGLPDLRDPRFANFGTGWYWSVEALSDPANRLASASLGGGTIPPPGDVPFDATFQRHYAYVDPRGEGSELSAVEARLFLGTGDEIFSFKITGNRDELSEEIALFQRQLIALLALFGLGFIIASFVIVRVGLRPISGATRRLADIREGRAERLEGDFPREIQPLIDETNALIESNRSVIERARTQVGNLAHSLKTPLAVLLNESKSAPPALQRIMLEQTGMMRDQVQNYLDRARIAARYATATSRTDAAPVLERLARVVGKLNPGLAIELVPEADGQAVFAGERQDFEEIVGNLLENAARFARDKVRLSTGHDMLEGKPALVIHVDDDGPGMSESECEIALQRGTRLDETTPGSGLGLSIVRDIATEYRGSLALGRSPLGGLRATVILPAR
ncbi:MAG: ATP-binding protein [Pseudomonadota bacterium]|nr:ATP-binding protein [Pseudomonadota bacterium]